jgi:hypothetical protein
MHLTLIQAAVNRTNALKHLAFILGLSMMKALILRGLSPYSIHRKSNFLHFSSIYHLNENGVTNE